MITVKKPPDKLWFPTLLQVANNIKTDSWFNILEKRNPNRTISEKETIKTTYTKTMKFAIYPTDEQKIKLNIWYGAIIDMYNITNKYMAKYYEENKKIETFISVRKKLLIEANKIVKNTNINKHVLDYSVKHCVEMYKSSITKLKKGIIKKFKIKDLNKDKNRHNLVLDPAHFSKMINGFCVTVFGEMKSQRNFINFFKSSSVLQYNKNTDKYYIMSPFNYDLELTKKREELCGIDLGVRTMATVYSPNKTLEIGTNLIPTIDKYTNKIDKINSDKDLKIITEQKYQKILDKYGNKMRNKINDLHKKVSVYLVSNFKNIHLGKISTSRIILNKTGNLKKITKRRMNVLSFFKFNEILKIMAKKYNCNILDINEYMTSKTCHNCHNINKDLGSSKIYICDKCNIKIDRDINAAINMYNKGLL
jgi:transposase